MKGPVINGKPHALVILRILEWDASGRPSKCIIGYDDTTFNLDEPNTPNEFLTAFINAEMIKTHTRN